MLFSTTLWRSARDKKKPISLNFLCSTWSKKVFLIFFQHTSRMLKEHAFFYGSAMKICVLVAIIVLQLRMYSLCIWPRGRFNSWCSSTKNAVNALKCRLVQGHYEYEHLTSVQWVRISHNYELCLQRRFLVEQNASKRTSHTWTSCHKYSFYS